MKNMNMVVNPENDQTEKHFRLNLTCAPNVTGDVIEGPGLAEERLSEISDVVAVLMITFGYST